MDNEAIFKTFLTELNMFKYCKENFKHGFVGANLRRIKDKEVLIEEGVEHLFKWVYSKYGLLYMERVDIKWRALCTKFNLKGYIDLEKMFNE